jgi:ketosteroid isomerase-like protein
MVAAALVLASCNTGEAPSANDTSATDALAIEGELKAIETAWEKDYLARDVDKAASHYSDDAALANPGMALATDAIARKMALTQFLSDPSIKVSFASDRVGVAQSGELAYTRGHYSIETADPATRAPKTETGSYLTVWRKQADGSWKAVEDFVTPGAPAAQ